MTKSSDKIEALVQAYFNTVPAYEGPRYFEDVAKANRAVALLKEVGALTLITLTTKKDVGETLTIPGIKQPMPMYTWEKQTWVRLPLVGWQIVTLPDIDNA